jgi:hypothetical protein
VVSPELDFDVLRYLRFVSLEVAFCGSGAMFGPVLAEATRLRGWRLALLTTVVTSAGVALGALALGEFFVDLLQMQIDEGRILSIGTFQLRLIWFHTVAGLLFAIYVRLRERELATIRDVQAAEIERAHSQRDLVESRLKVLQARVEPELLFGALADVEQFYCRDPASAEALLDDLIAYLRAALPQMRRDASTLSRETALVAAYLKVVPAARDGELAVASNVAPSLADASFPPLVLLSLASGAAKVRAHSVCIDAVADDATSVRVGMTVVSGIAPEGWSETALDTLRIALRQYLGEAATLDVAPASDRWIATLRWPLPVALR